MHCNTAEMPYANKEQIIMISNKSKSICKVLERSKPIADMMPIMAKLANIAINTAYKDFFKRLIKS